MRQLQHFGRFWYDFLVGDDVTIAVGIVVAMAATALVTANGQNAWWLMLAGVFVPLIVSVLRAADR